MRPKKKAFESDAKAIGAPVLHLKSSTGLELNLSRGNANVHT